MWKFKFWRRKQTLSKNTRIAVFALRVALGWIFLYAGLTKLADPDWTSAGYLTHANTFPTFFGWLATPGNIIWVDFLNEWGLTMIGLSLIFGVFVRLSSVFGALLMLLYYFPILDFPYAGDHSYLIDDHLIYAGALVLFALMGAGRYWGVDRHFQKVKWYKYVG